MTVLRRTPLILLLALLPCGPALGRPKSLAWTTAYLNRMTGKSRGTDYVTCDYHKHEHRAALRSVFTDLDGKVWAYSTARYTRTNARGIRISQRREIRKVRLDHISRIVAAPPFGNEPCSKSGYRALKLYCTVGSRCVDEVTINKDGPPRRKTASFLEVWLPPHSGRRKASKFERALEHAITLSKGDA